MVPDKRRASEPTGLLLAVIIAGILATILVPVFLRARDRARQAVCLANIRTICRAIQMYLGENADSFPPPETDPNAVAYFSRFPGRGRLLPWEDESMFPRDGTGYCHRSTQANPYLRWPVILDPYLPIREIWRCPNARLEGGARFINGAGPTEWVARLQAHQGEWGRGTGWCPMVSWPAGWGGEVTDSLTQRRLAVPITAKGRTASPGMFLQSIGVNTSAADNPSVSSVEDPSWYVICADAGATTSDFGTGTLAYPDLCRLECAGPGVWEADWLHCPWSRQCGAVAAMKIDPKLRQPYARHFGGVNIGFLDGHARWFHSEKVIEESPSTGNPNRGHLRGYHPWAPTRDAPSSGEAGGHGVPPLY